MMRAKIVNCKKASIIKDPSSYDQTDNQLIKSVPNGEVIEIDSTNVSYDLRNRVYYRVYEFGSPIGWIYSGAVEAKMNGKQYLNRD